MCVCVCVCVCVLDEKAHVTICCCVAKEQLEEKLRVLSQKKDEEGLGKEKWGEIYELKRKWGWKQGQEA